MRKFTDKYHLSKSQSLCLAEKRTKQKYLLWNENGEQSCYFGTDPSHIKWY